MAQQMDSIYTVHQYQQWDDTDWTNAIGFVQSFDHAYLWSKQETQRKFQEWVRTAEELRHKVQLIETADQFKYFEGHTGYMNSIHEGQNKIKYPVILPANVNDDTREFEIIWYIGVESTWNVHIDVLRWKFVKVDALPVVVTRIAK